MAVTGDDVMKLTHRIQQDWRDLGAKLVELRSMLSQLPLPEKHEVLCGRCGISVEGPRTLALHLFQVHDQPLPVGFEWA